MGTSGNAGTPVKGRPPPRPKGGCVRCRRPGGGVPGAKAIAAAIVAEQRRLETRLAAPPPTERPSARELAPPPTGAAAAAAGTPGAPEAPHLLVFAIDEAARRVVFPGGPELTGGGFAVVRALSLEHREDADLGRALADFRFVRATRLADRLDIDEPTLRQRIARARRTLSEQFRALCGLSIGDDAVIENHPWLGYRLNPRLLRASPAQVRGA